MVRTWRGSAFVALPKSRMAEYGSSWLRYAWFRYCWLVVGEGEVWLRSRKGDYPIPRDEVARGSPVARTPVVWGQVMVSGGS
ncbi:hypothetical protein SAMN04489712_105520 [Thermomonospora echinospora]|uniref:Uncharacterized protein n=1 Tax=Thermomonospora echinospora TaxID=1992 RepID=A0A1H6ALD9_9ACTN|nr:hypothetical protein SAMN04489712_105520 [Thermomonospora echinospora]